MAGQKSLIAVQLHRDGVNKSWGFRLQGGVDHGQLLTVQRVFMQSPSEGILHRGDAVIRINEFDATRMLLQDAEQIINNSAVTLRMEIQRGTRTGAPGNCTHLKHEPLAENSPRKRSGANTGTSTPTSPQPQAYQQGPPSFQRQTSQTYQQNLQFQQQQQQKHQLQDQQQPQGWQNSPTLQMIQQRSQGNAQQSGPRWDREQPVESEDPAPGVKNLMAREQRRKSGVLEYAVPLPNLDKLSVTNQTYRSNQLITPGPKAKHYRPMGSYLGNMGGGGSQRQDGFYDSGANTRSFNRGQQRPKSFYDQPGAQYGNGNASLSPYANGLQRQNSSSPAPQQLMGGRQWPPLPQPDSPPPTHSPAANQFQFNGQPQYQQQQYQQPQYQQQQYQQLQYQQQQYQQPQQQQGGQLPFQIPQPAQPGRRVVHSTYNSPAGLYTTQNAVDMFTGQTGLRPNQVTNKGKELTDFTQSPTYQLLQAQSGQKGGTAWGHAPVKQSRALNALDPYVADL